MERRCPYCASTDLELSQTNQLQCRSCGLKFWLNQEPAATEPKGPQPFMASRKISIGKLGPADDSSIYHSENIVRESEEGITTENIKQFTKSRTGYLIHSDEEIVGQCRSCGSWVSKFEFAICQAHSGHEILCGNCQYVLKDGRIVCRQAYRRTLILSILFFPFRILFVFLREILSLLFLKG